MTTFVQECFRTTCISQSINESMVVLIPRVKHATNFNHNHSISLYNFTYKTVAKILTMRMSKLMEHIISPNQGAFVQGQWIAKNTVVAQELVHKIRKHKGTNGLMLMKIDLRKAYDRNGVVFFRYGVACMGFL